MEVLWWESLPLILIIVLFYLVYVSIAICGMKLTKGASPGMICSTCRQLRKTDSKWHWPLRDVLLLELVSASSFDSFLPPSLPPSSFPPSLYHLLLSFIIGGHTHTHTHTHLKSPHWGPGSLSTAARPGCCAGGGREEGEDPSAGLQDTPSLDSFLVNWGKKEEGEGGRSHPLFCYKIGHIYFLWCGYK